MQTSSNILTDLLLGSVGPTQSVQGSHAGQTVPGAMPFDMILGFVSGSDIISNAVDNGKTQDFDLLGLLGSNNKTGQALTSNNDVQNGLNVQLTQLFNQLTQGLNAQNTKADSQQSHNINAELAQTETDGVNNAMMLMPSGALITNPHLLSVLNQTQIDLPEGNFQVLNSNVANGTMNLEVASKDNPSSTIKISIPTALIKKESNNTATDLSTPTAKHSSLTKVSLDSRGTKSVGFDDLLSKLKVSEIQITTSQSSADSIANSNVSTLTLTGEQNGAPIVLTARPLEGQVTATTTRKQANKTSQSVSGDGQSSADEIISGVGTKNVRASSNSEQVFNEFLNNKKSQSKLEKLLGDTTIKNDNQTSDTNGSFALMSKNSIINKGDQLDQPQVRLTISHELPQLEKLEGRTLMLKIEPDYLGPARLHLTLRDDTLSARVMVETSQAKAAVESSLNQLTDQLNKAGIKVDYIDVGVRGGGAQNQFSGRHADWFRSQSVHTRSSGNSEPAITEAASWMTRSREASFIGTNSVNIYA